MLSFFRRKKEEQDEVQMVKGNEDTLNYMRKEFGFTFRDDVEYEEFRKNTYNHAERRVLPVDITGNQIIAYTSYNGFEIGFYITADKGYGFYIKRGLPIKIFTSLIREPATTNENYPFLNKDVAQLLQFETATLDDLDYMKKIMNYEFQSYLELIIPSMRMKDKLIFNRNGMVLEMRRDLSQKEILATMSLLLQTCQNINELSDVGE